MSNNQQKRQRTRQAKPQAFGNQDKEQKFPITQDVIDKGLFVVKQYKNFTEQLPNGKVEDRGIEDPSTARIQVYTANTLEEIERENEREGKVNTIHKLGEKYIILHDPRKQTVKPADNDDEDDLSSSTKAELIDQLKGLTGVTDEDIKIAETPATKKAGIIELINKYKQA